MVTLRSAGPADESVILRLAEQLAAFPVPPWRTKVEIASADHEILREAIATRRGDAVVLMAENAAGNPIGVLFVSTRQDYFTAKPHAHVEVVALDPAAQGQGLGRLLMEEAERWARSRGYGSITLNVFATNSRAVAFYERLGYAVETLHLWKAL